MRLYKLAAALSAAILLASCGGGDEYAGGNPEPAAPRFSSLVSFGDSLSDVGTYAVGRVKELGGGKFTVNGPDSRIWIEHVAADLGQPAPCAAQTGLDGDQAQGFFAPVTNFPACTAYAQGGARVTDPVGPGNKLLGGANTVVGELTVPVATQMNNHLAAHGGKFKGDEIVFVMAGGNDLLMQLSAVASGANVLDAVSAMATAGTELAGQVQSITAAGAKYVTVVNLPDAGLSPVGLALSGEQRDLIATMTATFNTALLLGVSGNPDVLFVDAFALGRDEAADPARYGLTNITTPACDLSPERNPLASALICTKANSVPGVVDRYQFADDVHPTPYGHQLLADRVSSELQRRGWLK